MTKAKKVLLAIGSLGLLLLLVSIPIIYIEFIVPRSTVPTKAVVNPSVLNETDRRFLVSRGLSDPVNDIINDLSKHPELIPCKGTLGGTPDFVSEEIIIHGQNRVAATFSDGHYDGQIELTFKVSQGNIVWKAIKWNCHGYD